MLIRQMHHEFNLTADRIASQDRPDFYPNEIDDYLNRAIKMWVRRKYGSDNPKKMGFETSQERISELMSLHINYPLQPAITPINKGNGIYEIKLNTLAFPYLFLTGAQVVISKGDCKHTVDHTMWQIDDRKNTFNEPNFDWRRVHANFSRNSTPGTANNSLYSLYFDTTDFQRVQQFNVDSVYLSYIKSPNRVCIGTYKHIDDTSTGTTSAVVHCDIHEDFIDEIITLAAMLALGDMGDQVGFKINQVIDKEDY